MTTTPYRYQLVRGDTLPQIVLAMKDAETGVPVDLVGATPRLKFRMVNASTLQATVLGTLLAGTELDDGTVSYADPYGTPGRGGRVSFAWAAGDLDGPPGQYEGEVEITFPGGEVQTVYEKLKFTVREQF